MKLHYALVFFSALQLSSINAERLNPRHRDLRLKRQPASPPPPVNAPAANTPPPPLPPPPSTPAVTNNAPSPSLPVLPGTASHTTITTTTTTSGSGLSSTSTATVSGNSTVLNGTTTVTTPTGPPPLDTGTSIPPLANITLGMPTQAPLPVSSLYAPGATPPNSGAPVLPTPLPVNTWPPLDKVPDTSSSEVQAWMKELDGFDIPNLAPTTDGTCGSDPALAADASNRGWWTCGGWTRDTDIVACPNYLTWGVSFDDGPSLYTQKLLNYLGQKAITATFFVVGSRCVEYPNVLIEEYMSGHEISVHTWSHPHLTTLTNEQIVAELGWTRKAIRSILGITPLVMRPPFGDIDDRVRAICLAMGLIPVLWTSTHDGGKFDTNDWRVASGTISGNQSVQSFEQILTNATTIDTGFIVLEHDLFETTVDLAVGYTLNLAETFQPKLDLQPIGQCSGLAPNNIYLETNKNTSFPYHNQTGGASGGGGGIDVNGDGSVIGSGGGGRSASGDFRNCIPMLSSLTIGGAVIAFLSIVL